MSMRKEIFQQINEAGVETIRFVFTDQHGVMRGKTMTAALAETLLTTGIKVPSSLLLKDTSQRTVFPVWQSDAGFGEGILTGAGDIVLLPDMSTWRILPWAPHSAWVLCDVILPGGDPVMFAPRQVLKTARAKLHDKGFDLHCGLEVEFHIFRLVELRLDHDDAGMPARAPQTALLTQGYQLLSQDGYDALEDILDELRRHADALGLGVRSVEIEFGPGQVEFTFEPGGSLKQADNLVMFRTMVKQVCARRGLHATFMCRPAQENSASSGWHLHQSLLDLKTRENLFMPQRDGEITSAAGSWIAGLLAHAAESCLLTTPSINGYKRYRPHQLAPDRMQWGYDNKGAMIRVLFAAGDAASRIENRVPESAANPYYCLTAQILSGLNGLEQQLKPPPAAQSPYDHEAPRLPGNLGEAIMAFCAGRLFEAHLGAGFADYLTQLKQSEWQRYLASISDWEQNEYFTLF